MDGRLEAPPSEIDRFEATQGLLFVARRHQIGGPVPPIRRPGSEPGKGAAALYREQCLTSIVGGFVVVMGMIL